MFGFDRNCTQSIHVYLSIFLLSEHLALMSGKHITEAVWFNARKVLPDSARSVVVLYRRFIGSKTEMHISEAVFQNRTSTWAVDSKLFNPSVDIVTQWAEIDPTRGGFKPDDFPLEQHSYEYVSNRL